MATIQKSIFLIIFLSLSLFAQDTKSSIVLSPEEKVWLKSNPKITVGMLNNFTPFTYISKDGHQGFSVDILKKVEEISGLNFEIKTARWSSIMEDFKSGNIDIITDISHTKKREPFTLFTKPYFEIPTYIFGLKSDNSYKTNASLEGKTLAVSKGLFYIDTIKQMGIKVLELDSSFEKAKAVVAGKADYFISSYTTGIKAIRDNSITTLKVMDEFYGIKKEDLRYGVGHHHPHLHSILDKSLAKISQNEINSLANKWIVFSAEQKVYKTVNFSKEELEYLRNNPIVKYSEVNWKPLSIIENNKMKGIMGDFLDIVEKRTGLKFEFVPSESWPHVLQQFRQKRIDLVPGVGSSPQERSLGRISKRYAKYPMVIVTSQEITYLDSLNDLKNKTIAVPRYYTSHNFIKKNYPDMKLIVTDDIPEALLLVQKGKADAFVGHIATSIFYISELHLKDLKVSGTTLFDFEHHYLVQRDNPILLSIINKTFDSITYKERKEIYSNWIQTTVVEKTVDYTSIYIIIFITLIIIVAFGYRQHLLKKYNKSLKQSYDDIESIINSTMEAIIISKDRVCIDVNESALKLFNYKSKEEIIGKDLLSLISGNYKELVSQKVNINNCDPYELEIINARGVILPALGRGTNLRIKGKDVRISSIIDLSEIKNKERLLIEQSKMAALGEMIGHIAHQWRQPLSIITTITSSWGIYNELGKFDKKRVLEESKSILNSANYLSQTIDDFRLFIKGENNVKEFNIKLLMENLTRLITPSLQNSQVELLLTNDIEQEIQGSQNEILQALINIVNNSIDAINQNRKIDKKMIFIETIKDKDNISISITDNAGGIPEKIINKIFEPYFTTKHESNGTGLGLYMTYSIIKKMGEEIKVLNVKYEYDGINYTGAKFIVSLPSKES